MPPASLPPPAVKHVSTMKQVSPGEQLVLNPSGQGAVVAQRSAASWAVTPQNLLLGVGGDVRPTSSHQAAGLGVGTGLAVGAGLDVGSGVIGKVMPGVWDALSPGVSMAAQVIPVKQFVPPGHPPPPEQAVASEQPSTASP
mmetsp:Transcript_14920/g.32529  ORF Transcript_14920/g.32529 Transcript_14920/m.32529 type:complete len:141 (-) Transcript_14920:1213-1635(-)